jgi:hypothetical protein
MPHYQQKCAKRKNGHHGLDERGTADDQANCWGNNHKADHDRRITECHWPVGFVRRDFVALASFARPRSTRRAIACDR